MQITDLTDGKGANDGAFCPDKMAAAGVDNLALSRALAAAMQPFAALLKDGHGVGAYLNDGKGSVIGFTAPNKAP